MRNHEKLQEETGCALEIKKATSTLTIAGPTPRVLSYARARYACVRKVDGPWSGAGGSAGRAHLLGSSRAAFLNAASSAVAEGSKTTAGRTERRSGRT